ncbi:unnamed protein product [Penicillium salamii]|uniref:DUF7703 domain-containing protein n=1 Tax=Penicillium salamii TaxID=1612424 RepID=A0A9W4NUF3_9EURO|nr:unnamed protein product [Penicillium salamii]CAG8180051.1 unnamed protein product [Penicillium salamii]CAG8215668.1 unnamed protein product [Penicillium salamii]CAG8246291.1 unnamed protein product [Penicillium salamii]CAG8272493.1 unnamed protein product [Penicillium salamii]
MDSTINVWPSETYDVIWKNLSIIQTIAMFSISGAGALEVVVSIFESFKKYRGLYFWSMQIAAWGIFVHAITSQARLMGQASNLAMTVPFAISWICMVTGQAMVLYSRLHLVVNDVRHIRWVLWMIIVNFVILHAPMTGLFFCINLGGTECVLPAQIYDRLQIVGFAVQDIVICTIYIREALKALKPIFAIRGRSGRRVIHWLLFVNACGIILDLLTIVTEFKYHNMTVGFKVLAYCIKLKLEFFALTQLRDLTRRYPCTLCQGPEGNARGSSEANIFDIYNNTHQPETVQVESSPSFVGTISPPPPQSTRSSTYDFHEVLRQTVSTENSAHLQTNAISPIRSDTRSTVEMTLLQSPK